MAYSAISNGRRQTRSAMAEINITPLVDVVLVLLLIFMLTAPVLQSGIDVAIPHTRSTSTLTEERMVVTIDKDQNVYLQAGGPDRQINLANLAAQLQAHEKAGADPARRTVYVRADERVPFGAFATVMESIKRAGITNISIVTQPIQK
jgi:biopolymer transport protein ExbD/biopolymer transport protein TolR